MPADLIPTLVDRLQLIADLLDDSRDRLDREVDSDTLRQAAARIKAADAAIRSLPPGWDGSTMVCAEVDRMHAYRAIALEQDGGITAARQPHDHAWVGVIGEWCRHCGVVRRNQDSGFEYLHPDREVSGG